MPASVRIVTNEPQMGRKIRSPKHDFSLRVRPWQIQPFMIAPVLPGETLKNLLIQSRVVTDPIKAPLVGWWIEYYFFYVKHRDLTTQWPTLMNMHMANASTTTLERATIDQPSYTFAGGIDYTNFCLRKVVEEYFRDEEDGAWNAAQVGGMPAAMVNRFGVFESIRDATAATVNTDQLLIGEREVMPFGSDAAFATQYAQWEQMRALKMTAATFEDWLSAWGVKTPEVEETVDRPELLRYIREWSYPSNTIDPTNGTPRSAVSWTVTERGDKDRFFSEPGFIFGVQVCRPKVYFSKQKGAAVGMMNDAYSWLPPAVVDAAWTSVKQYTNLTGPLAGNVTNGYWLDLRDLFVFGDQFINYDTTADPSGSTVSLPLPSSANRFAPGTDADALFVAPAVNKIKSDGIVTMSIASRVRNET